MGKRLDPEFVRQQFEKEGYTITGNYVDTKTPVEFTCSNGHNHILAYKALKKGYRCPYCSGNNIDPDSVTKLFEDEGYTLLTKYVSQKIKLKFICPNGHEHSMGYRTFAKGHRCAICKGVAINPETVYKAFEKEGYKVHSEYKNSATPLSVTCPEGHITSMTYASIKELHKCIYCARRKVDPNMVHKAFLDAGYTLLGEYEKADSKIPVLCPNKHEISLSWTCFQQNPNRCIQCSGRVVTQAQVEEKFKSEGYILLNEYKNSKSLLEFICPVGHHHYTTWHRFRNHKCAKCTGAFKNELDKQIVQIKIMYLKQIMPKVRSYSKTGVPVFTDSKYKKIAKDIVMKLGSIQNGYALDHLIPAFWFNLTIESELNACWNISNLRYLPKRENLVRGASLSQLEFENLTATQKLIFLQASKVPSKYVHFQNQLRN
jgi:Zn-finger nucleic acid-binding protein